MKILVSDFDYTFLNLEYQKNIEAVQQFVYENNIFILATSRNIAQLELELENFKVPHFFLICNDGATIYDRNLKCLYEKTIEKEISIKIFDKLDQSKYILETYIDTGHQLTVSSEANATHILAKPKNILKAQKLLDTILKQYNNVTGYIMEGWIHITPKGVSKGKAINHLVERFHFDTKQIFVVGDNINDLSMFEHYSGFALEHADPALKEKASKIVNNFEEVINYLNSSKK